MKTFLKKFEILSTIWFFAQFNPGLFTLVSFFSLLSGLLEGFGLSMFVPLMLNTNENSQVGVVVSSLMSFLQNFGVATHLQATLLVMIGIFFLRNVSRFYELYFKAKFEQGFLHIARTEVLAGLFQMKYGEYIKKFQPTGTALLTADISILNQCIQSLFGFIVNSGTAFTLAIAALAINPWASFFGLVFGGFLVVILKWVNGKTKEISISITESTRDFVNLVQEIFDNYRYLRSTHQNESFKMKAICQSDINRKGMIKIMSASGLNFALNQFLAILFLCGIIFFAVEVRDQPVARVVISIAIMYRIISMFTFALNNYQGFMTLIGSFYSVQSNMSFLKLCLESSGSIEHHVLRDSIRFEAVEFIESKQKLISELSCEIKKGEFVGLLGRTGAGKSLLTQLLTGLITPTSGRVLIDGIEIEQLNLASWRSRIGYVPQDFGVFNGTFREAVCGTADLTDQKQIALFEKVIQQANLEEVLNILPEGAETRVGKGGHPLSGGQKQRIAIARELFREPEILILDEATNSLDVFTQESIARVIESIRGQMTIIMIAHRLRMVAKADHLIVMEKGKIIMDGGPEVLEKYESDNQSEEEDSDRRPAPRLWVGVRDDIQLHLPELSSTPLKVTDLSISGLSFFGEESWVLSRISEKSYEGALQIGARMYQIQVQPVRFAAGRLGGPLIKPSTELTDAIQNCVMDSFVVDARKTG